MRRGRIARVWGGAACVLAGLALAPVASSQHTLAAGAAEGAPGACRVLDPELQLSYVGGCDQGLAQGQGVARGADGAWYRGGFEAGMKSGHGVKLYPNGDAYVGGWRADRREGAGRYEYGPNSPWRGDVYQGGWRADRQHGRGVYIFYPSGDRFEADWVDGATETVGTTTVSRRKQALEVLAPVVGRPGAQVCSISTAGAGPDRVARGEVLGAISDRILVRIDSPAVLARSPDPDLNPRWEIMTEWLPCP